ncbi:glycoside hydrolase family 32 protein [Lacrimispora saccharolytica]|nr:glycoside hydrolase family 32 protein [Lacrimispora saccharolytica]
MSTKGSRNYRPNIHFTPPAMWTNDPNGMVYVNGIYHLFYQHYPEAPNWGPMHWGHAVSRDLLHWKHMPIALYPDELGMIFSGSCVYDRENTSGYGTKEKPPIVAVYTNHGRHGLEQQSIAYSTDGIHFEKSYQNPVIPNPGISDFRDPKAFYNPVKNCWSLVLAAGDRVHFYKSEDLKRWEKTGEFGPEGNLASGVWECPDLFQVEAEDGRKLWVLIVSMTTTTEDGRCRTQYFLGDFDGDKFIQQQKEEEPLWIDFGFDNYAGVTFQNLEEPLFLGWAMNWGYANETPTGEYCGQMTLARSLRAVKTEKGYRLAASFAGLEKYQHSAYPVNHMQRLCTDTFGMKVTGTKKITLSNAHGQKLVIQVTEDEVFVDRTHAGEHAFHEQFQMPQYCSVRIPRMKQDGKMELIFDVSVLEVLADDGLIPVSMVAYPEAPYDQVLLEGSGNVELYEIRE